MYAKKDCACIPYTHFCDWLHRTVEIHAAQLGYPPSPLQRSDAGRRLFQGVVHWSRKKYNSASRQSHWHPLEPGTCRWGSSVSSFHHLKRVFHILYIGKFTKLMYCLWYGRGWCRVQTSLFAQLSAMLVGIDGGSSLSVHFFHQLFSVFLFWKSMVFPTLFSNFHFNFTVPECLGNCLPVDFWPVGALWKCVLLSVVILIWISDISGKCESYQINLPAWSLTVIPSPIPSCVSQRNFWRELVWTLPVFRCNSLYISADAWKLVQAWWL